MKRQMALSVRMAVCEDGAVCEAAEGAVCEDCVVCEAAEGAVCEAEEGAVCEAADGAVFDAADGAVCEAAEGAVCEAAVSGFTSAKHFLRSKEHSVMHQICNTQTTYDFVTIVRIWCIQRQKQKTSLSTQHRHDVQDR